MERKRLIDDLRAGGLAVPLDRTDVEFMRRSGQSRSPAPLWDPYQPIAQRTHTEPPGWKPGFSEWRPIPMVAMPLVTVPRDEPGEPLWFGVYGLLIPGSEDVWVPRLFWADDASEEEQTALTDAARSLGLTVVGSRRDFLDDLWRYWYKDRAALASWDPGVDLGRLAVGWTRAEKGQCRGGISLILWSKVGEPDPKRPQVFDNGEVEDGHRPRISLRSIDGVRNLISVSGRGEADKEDKWGRHVIVSVHALAEAQLGGEQVRNLADACRAFELPGPPARKGDGLAEQVEAATGELRALAGLYRVLIDQHRQLMPQRPPSGAISVGSYASALLEWAGLRPRLELQPDFPRDILAAAMAASFGGEVFTQLRAPDIPVCSLDVGGLYAVSAMQGGAWELYTARSVQVRSRDPAATTAYVERLARRMARWRDTPGARTPIKPTDRRRLARTKVWVRAAADVLPHKVPNRSVWKMRVAPLSRGQPVPMWLGDVVDTVLETGAIPEIVRAVRLVPRGRQHLLPVQLPTGRRVDPNRQDLIAEIAIERARLESQPMSPARRKRLRSLLKGLANSIASGLPIQVLDDEPTARPRPQLVWDPDTGEKTTRRMEVRETPGAFYFPPITGGITACGRLNLHIAKRLLEAWGGTVGYGDTDSLQVFATPQGGPVPMPGGSTRTRDWQEAVWALSYTQIQEIRWKLEDLSLYPPELQPCLNSWDADGWPVRIPLPRLWKREAENDPPPEADGFPSSGLQLDVNAAKKPRLYHLITPGDHVEIREGQPMIVPPTPEQLHELTRVVVVKASEHGVIYTPPGGADPDSWVADAYTPQLARDLGLPANEPDWLAAPAIALEPCTRIDKLGLHPKARPFSKLAVWPTELAEGRPVTAWHPGFDPLTAEWFTCEAETETRIPAFPFDRRTGTAAGPNGFIGKTIGSALRRLRRAPEHGATTLDGVLCGHGSRGVLIAGHTIATGRTLIGKESRRLGDGRGVLTEAEYLIYQEADSWPQTLAILQEAANQPSGIADLAATLEVSEQTVRNILHGRTPSDDTRVRITHLAEEHATRQLAAMTALQRLPETAGGRLAAYLDQRQPMVRTCAFCGRPLPEDAPASQRYCGPTCRQRAHRQRSPAGASGFAAPMEHLDLQSGEPIPLLADLPVTRQAACRPRHGRTVTTRGGPSGRL